METGTGMLLIAGACVLVLLIGSIKNRMEWLLTFGIRHVMGGIATCLINSMMKRWGIDCQVGLGPVRPLKFVPLDRLFLETDEGNMPIDKLYRKAARIRNLSTHRLRKSIKENISQIFTFPQQSRQ